LSKKYRSRLFNLQVSLLFLLLVPLQAQPPGLYVNDRFLFSASGDTVILKGFNAMIVYWDIHGEANFPEIEKTGANCVRIFWKLAYPTPQPSDLDRVLNNCIQHHMIPIICLWDATGEWEKIQYCVDYWCSEAITPILQKYEKHLIVNIANEAGSTAMEDTVFRNTYASAVQQMRDAGIHTPIMIDADRWGRNADAVLDNGEYLLQQDPDHNLVFSWHLWDPQNWGVGTLAEIERIITKATEKNICFVVGEFGPCERCDNCPGTPINWEYLIEKAYQNRIGYLPWVWKWTDCHAIVDNSTGAYGSWVNPPWGESVAVSSPYSIEQTARRPSDLMGGVKLFVPGDHPVKVKPNPFSDAVEFSIPVRLPSEVVIEIYDLSDRRVALLEEKQVPPGWHTMRWSPSDSHAGIPAGIYLYRIEVKHASGVVFRTGKIVRYSH